MGALHFLSFEQSLEGKIGKLQDLFFLEQHSLPISTLGTTNKLSMCLGKMEDYNKGYAACQPLLLGYKL